MKMLSITKGLKRKTYKFKLTPEEFTRLDILAKQNGITKDEWLQAIVDRAYRSSKITHSERGEIDLFTWAVQCYLKEKVEESEARFRLDCLAKSIEEDKKK